MRIGARALILGATVIWAGLGGPAAAADRHAGYYYPEPGTREVYEARSQTLPEADRGTRIGFVTGIANRIAGQPYPPQAAMFAKGTEAEKLIIVALVDGRMDTIYRARAVLANMTAAARMLPAFQELGVESRFTFLDLAHMLGFKQLTISNGRDFAHQVIIE
jgi:hypothetical protein